MKKRMTIRKITKAALAFLAILASSVTAMENEAIQSRTSADYQKQFLAFKESAVRMRQEVDRRLANVTKKKEAYFKKVAPGVYAGEATVGNETVYFGMERIDDDNKWKWERYRKNATFLTQGSTRNKATGLLVYLSSKSAQGIQPSFTDEIKKESGFTKSEYTRFMNKLDKVVQNSKDVAPSKDVQFDIGSHKNTKSIVNALAGVPIGSAVATSHNYVVYASKKPVTGRFPFSFPNSNKGYYSQLDFTLKEYYQYFGDILMMVYSNVKSDTNEYENRGIFKNPISFIEDPDKYPGLSIILHAFSSIIAHHISNRITHLEIHPAEAMLNILLKQKWSQDELLIGKGKITYDFLKYPGGIEKIKEMWEPECFISIKALMRLYAGQ